MKESLQGTRFEDNDTVVNAAEQISTVQVGYTGLSSKLT